MILTDERIEVTFAMMEKANMTRGSELGIPLDPAKPVLGLRWKQLQALTPEDYDALETYFLSKQLPAEA